MDESSEELHIRLVSANDEKRRWASTMQSIPVERQEMAKRLLSNSDLDSSEIVKACRAGIAPEPVEPSLAENWRAGKHAARVVLGKEDVAPELIDFAAPPLEIDQDEYEVGEEVARLLAPLAQHARQ